MQAGGVVVQLVLGGPEAPEACRGMQESAEALKESCYLSCCGGHISGWCLSRPCTQQLQLSTGFYHLSCFSVVTFFCFFCSEAGVWSAREEIFLCCNWSLLHRESNSLSSPLLFPTGNDPLTSPALGSDRLAVCSSTCRCRCPPAVAPP